MPSASALTPELLIGWVDHPQEWVQALGRQRLTQHMSAPEASLCLTRLAQHPGTSVQLFVTQWLLSLPDESAAARAQRLADLKPYFLAVLSQVLSRAGRDDYALITVLAGIAAVLIMLLPYLSQLLDAVNGMLGG